MLVRGKQLTVEFGFIKDYPSTVITYDGDDEAGVTITIEAAYGGAEGIRINNTTRNEYIIIDNAKVSAIMGGTGLTKYDTIVIDTTRGNKSAKLIRDGVSHGILNAVDISSKWIQIQKGDNVFTGSATSGFENLIISVSYKVSVLGV